MANKIPHGEPYNPPVTVLDLIEVLEDAAYDFGDDSVRALAAMIAEKLKAKYHIA